MRKKYDVIIIGSGIGGLVCGCLLSKAGIKTLILEKNNFPGGYCSSLQLGGCEFDAFAHSIGDLSKNGQLNRILQELKVKKHLKLIRYNPSDKIIAKDLEVNFWNSREKTIKEFSSIFPDEKENIEYFFNKIINRKGLESVNSFRNKTFKEILDQLFKNEQLKRILSLPILGNLGVPGFNISAFTAVKHYKQFIVDGGYYPGDGMQSFSDILAKTFRDFGGTLLFSSKVESIVFQNKEIKGVLLKNGLSFLSKIIVSDCDLRETFFKLVGKRKLDLDLVRKIDSLKPSLSLFIIYLIIENPNKLFPVGVNVWRFKNYQYSDDCKERINFNFDEVTWTMTRMNRLKNGIMIFSNAPYKNQKFWSKNKNKFLKEVVKQSLGNRISKKINLKNIYCMTPYGLQKLTGNYKGAAYGWASIPSQVFIPEFTRDQAIKNLFLCGHWSSIGPGISGVAIGGERIAKIILERIKV